MDNSKHSWGITEYQRGIGVSTIRKQNDSEFFNQERKI